MFNLNFLFLQIRSVYMSMPNRSRVMKMVADGLASSTKTSEPEGCLKFAQTCSLMVI